MFNFFKRSRKDSEKVVLNKEKKHKEVAEQLGHSPTTVSEDMCKNNSLTQKLESGFKQNSLVSLVPNQPTVSELKENGENAVASAMSPNNENFETKLSNTINMNRTDIQSNKQKPPVSYACVLKNNDHVHPRTSCVKPCGHGTVAISTGIPVIGFKRENKTPPTSPKLEIKKIKERDVEKDEVPRSTVNDRLGSTHSENVIATDEVKLTTMTPSPSSNITDARLALSGATNLIADGTHDAEKKNLINQETKFQSHLNDLSKQLSIRDAEAIKLRFQMEELQRDVFAKSAGMDRLQAELQAAHKETEITKLRIRHLESDLASFRENNGRLNEKLQESTEEYQSYEITANAKIAELREFINQLQAKIHTLEEQIEVLKQEKCLLEVQHDKLKTEKEEESKKNVEVLEKAVQQKLELERKWKEDFEKLRTVNILKEQQLLDDFEWKLREIQQSCKRRLEEKDKNTETRVQEACKEAEMKMKEAEETMKQLEDMKSYETEVVQLRDLTIDQEKSLRYMMQQQEQMKTAENSLKTEAKRLRTLIEIEKENIQHLQRTHHQELLDKERKLKETLSEKRMEIAMYWEDKLLHEISRLKYELEQLHTEEQYYTIQNIRREKDEQFETAKEGWEKSITECLKEMESLKKCLEEKDCYFQEEILKKQTKTDQDILDLRRLMDKIDMNHHERFEKLVQEHEIENEQMNKETEERINEIEDNWKKQCSNLRNSLQSVKDQMEQESQLKIESLIEQHRSELEAQWVNLIHQKQEAVNLVENEFVSKHKMLEDQFLTQKKSHENREIELLKIIDTLKNELESKISTIDDLQNNVDTLEGGIQVLNQEIAQQGDDILKTGREADHRVRTLQETVNKLHRQQENEREAFRLKLMSVHKQSQETIDHLQKKCSCLTKLFEEVRLRYERRDSRQEDLTVISDLRQVIAEQEKDLACMNEEKRYFQMRLISLERSLEPNDSEEEFQDAEQLKLSECSSKDDQISLPPPPYPAHITQMNTTAFSIPPTIQECDDGDE